MRDDETRQIERKDDADEVFEVGDAPSQRRRSERGAVVPWLLAIMAPVGAAAVYFLVAMPAKDRADVAEAKVVSLSKQLAEDTQRLKGELDEKGKLADSLAAESQKKDELLKELEGTKKELEEKLKDEISVGDVLIKQSAGELVVDLADKILFPSGEAELNDKGKEVLKRVGETMLKVEGKIIQVGGHTDDQPISDRLKARFPSNWELSATRALNVVHYLEDDVKVPGTRLLAAGFSQFRPVAKNKTKEGRAKNRRIEVVLLPFKKKA